MRANKYIYPIVGTVILLFLIWFYFNFWLFENNVVLAAIIQVVGLVIIGFLANKWLADYNWGKTVKLERHKLRIQLLHRLANSLDKARTFALQRDVQMGEYIGKRGTANEDRYFAAHQEATLNFALHIGILRNVRTLSKHAYENHNISKNISEITNLLLYEWPERAVNDRDGIKQLVLYSIYVKKLDATLENINKLGNVIEESMGSEIGEWLGSKTDKGRDREGP